MPSQADFERVKKYVIEPMKNHFGMMFDAGMIDDYVDDLAGYSEEVLKGAMRDLRISHTEIKRKPVIGQLIVACKKHLPVDKPREQSKQKYPWEVRQELIDAMIADFMKIYANSPLVAQARAEGWVDKLLNYAQNTAWVQAQIICQCPNIGYRNDAYFWGPATKYKEISEKFIEFCRRQAATYSIAVEVPNEAIAVWKPKAA